MLSAAHCFDLDETGQVDLNELVLRPMKWAHEVVFELERKTDGWPSSSRWIRFGGRKRGLIPEEI